MWHAVEVTLELDVVVDVDLDGLPATDDEVLCRQRSQRRSIQLLEGAASAAWQLLERPLVEIDQQQANRLVELVQGEEAPVAQPRQDPALHQQHRALDLGLVTRVRGPSGQDGAAVVLGELLVAAVGLGVVAVGTPDQRTGLVRHDQSGNPAEELQCLDLGSDPVGGGLARCGAGVGAVRCAQCGNEDLGLGDLARGGVNDGNGAAGIVDEQLLPGNVNLPHRACLGLGELAVLDAKAGVLVGQCIAGGVLLPQQHQRDAGSLEFLVDLAEVGGQLVARPWHRRTVQARLQFSVIQAIGHGAIDASDLGQRDVLADHALGDLERAAHLVVTQPCLQVQAQCLSDTAHGDSVCWH